MAVFQNARVVKQLSRVGFRAVGRYRTGGRLEILVDGRRRDELSFSSAEWIVLVLLLKAAKRVSADDPFAAYVDVCHLVEQMQDISAQLRTYSPFRAVVSETVHRNICKLREKLKQATARESLFGDSIAKDEWAPLLLERDQQLGYRLNVLPNNVDIVFLP